MTAHIQALPRRTGAEKNTMIPAAQQWFDELVGQQNLARQAGASYGQGAARNAHLGNRTRTRQAFMEDLDRFPLNMTNRGIHRQAAIAAYDAEIAAASQRRRQPANLFRSSRGS